MNARERAELREAMRLAGITDEYGFSDYLHACKEGGDRGTKNARGDFTREELLEKAREFKELYETRGEDE